MSMTHGLLDEIERRARTDERADGNRSKWIRDALVARIHAEDDGSWEVPEPLKLAVEGD